MVVRSFLFFFLFLFLSGAQAQVAVPPVARFTDQTGTLTGEQKATLERTLQEFEKRKGSQIAVLMVPTTAPETVEQYALRVAEKWKLGRKGVDDGALLVIAKNDRAMRIEIGYGLEGALNDAAAKRIVSEVITPRFKEGDFFGGISAGVDRMLRVIDGEPLPAPRQSAQAPAAQGTDLFSLLPVLLIAAMVVGGILRAILGRGLGSLASGGAVGFLAWMLAGTLTVGLIAGAVAFVFSLMGGGGAGRRYGRVGGGGFGGGGFGGGGFGGGGGGGFGGGGGSFGGGGASGRW